MLLEEKQYQRIARYLGSKPRWTVPVSKGFQFLRKGEPCWDPWILKDDDAYRIFYLIGTPKKGEPWWSEARICGGISSDLKHWDDLGVLLEPNSETSWESARLLAGSAYKEDDIYYLFYGGAGGINIRNEGIGLATSKDCLNWQRPSSPFLKPDDDNPYYGKYGDHFFWRDPYVVRDHKDGRYYMFVTAVSKEGEPSEFRGCVALAVADKLSGSYTLLPPAASPTLEGTKESIYKEMERPQVIWKNGKYHLFFSCWKLWVNPKWEQRKEVTSCSLYWYVSEEITGPFKPVSEKPIVEGSSRSGLYAINLLPAPDRPDEFIAYGWYHRMRTIEVAPIYRVIWKDDSIEIKYSPNTLK
jgi:beta-fructofuranosidase